VLAGAWVGLNKMDFDAQTILLVEDNEGDIFLFKRCAGNAGVRNPIQVVRTGEQAVGYLAGTGKYEDRTQYPLPSLVLLDLKLPLKDGLDVLQWMRTRTGLDSMKVVVLTSSAHSRDIERAYELGALAYLVKPPAPDNLGKIMSSLRAGEPKPGTRLEIPGCLFVEAKKGQ
jgi:CheY-like chemotaxis protein